MFHVGTCPIRPPCLRRTHASSFSLGKHLCLRMKEESMPARKKASEKSASRKRAPARKPVAKKAAKRTPAKQTPAKAQPKAPAAPPSAIGLLNQHMDYTTHRLADVKRFYTDLLG